MQRIDAAYSRLPCSAGREILDALCDAWVEVGFNGGIRGFNSGFSMLTGGEVTPCAVEALFPAGLRPAEQRESCEQTAVVRHCSLSTPCGPKSARVVYSTAEDCVLAAVVLSPSADAPQRAAASFAAQAEDRRKIARYLHDTVSQNLVVLGLTLSKSNTPESAGAGELHSALDLVGRCCRDLRVISHALAPPLVEDHDPAAVFEWYIAQLREDAGLDVSFQAGPGLRALPRESGQLLIAVIQEWALRAIQSGSVGKTTIRLKTLVSGVQLELLSDQPDCEPVAALTRCSAAAEAIRALGGALNVERGPSGVRAAISIVSV